ncbi:MAG: hypothetical protein GYA02_02925 [Clostridiaceae bacterium]|nr:hypothetical protein [Clostridiaceae bacterium]NMB95552.1 hypothetical protein [Clostridiaceae bacterium]
MGKKSFVGAVKGKNADIIELVEREVPDVSKEVKDDLVKKLVEEKKCGDAGVGEVNPYRARAEMLREKYSNMTPSERSARLQQLAEENAYRRLQEMENSIPGAHFLEKHGAQTTLQSQLDRVQFGINPTTKVVETWPNGNIKYPSSGTRFLNYRDQLNAIQRAQQILKNTGNKTMAESLINFNYIIGSGYKRNPLQYGESYSAQVWFNNSNQPITAFPKWGE